MEHDEQTFSYTYSAGQREEVERIRKKYLPVQEDKLEQLRRLDESAARPGRIAALVLGTRSALVFGLGLCCTTLWTDRFVFGVVIGAVGLAGIAAAYPLYAALTRRQRARRAPEILRLSQELMNGR